MGPRDERTKREAGACRLPSGDLPPRRTVGLCRPPAGPVVGQSPQNARPHRGASRGQARFQRRHQWIARARGAWRGGVPRRSRLAARRICPRRHFFRHLGLSDFAHHSQPMRGRTFLARDVLRPPRQTHPACASRSGELRLDCRLVHGGPRRNFATSAAACSAIRTSR